MNKKRYLIMSALFFLCAVTLCACGNKEKKNKAQENKIINVTGKVSLVNSQYTSDIAAVYDENGQSHATSSGTLFFYEITIENEEKVWYIADIEKNKLYDYQRRTVTVEAIEQVYEMKFASGMSAPTRYVLSNVVILEVKDDPVTGNR